MHISRRVKMIDDGGVECTPTAKQLIGEDILRRGKFAQLPGRHMGGGLDKARRTGITKPIPKEF